jgi:hypothetical protein
MAEKLNRGRPFGTVLGDFYGARYYQDGRHFDVHGHRVIVPGDPQWPVVTPGEKAAPFVRKNGETADISPEVAKPPELDEGPEVTKGGNLPLPDPGNLSEEEAEAWCRESLGIDPKDRPALFAKLEALGAPVRKNNIKWRRPKALILEILRVMRVSET